MKIDHNLLDIVACPLCKGKLQYDRENNNLICRFDRLAYPIEDGIPALLEEKARELSPTELEK